MKRAITQNQPVAQQQVASRQNDKNPDRGPLPDFIKKIREIRKDVLNAIASAQSTAEREFYVKKSYYIMRSAQIINAFIYKRKLSSVECGQIDNIKFQTALEDATRYMAVMAENVHNKAFDAWVEENLREMGYGDQIIRVTNRNFVLR